MPRKNPLTRSHVYKVKGMWTWEGTDAQDNLIQSRWDYATKKEAENALAAYERVRKGFEKK